MKIAVLSGVTYASGDVYDLARDAEDMKQLYDLAVQEGFEREEIFEEDGRRVRVRADADKILPLLEPIIEAGMGPFYAEVDFNDQEDLPEEDDEAIFDRWMEGAWEAHGPSGSKVLHELEEV